MRSQITEIMCGLSTNSVIVSPCLMVDRAIYPKAGLAGCLEPIWWRPMEFHGIQQFPCCAKGPFAEYVIEIGCELRGCKRCIHTIGGAAARTNKSFTNHEFEHEPIQPDTLNTH